MYKKIRLWSNQGKTKQNGTLDKHNPKPELDQEKLPQLQREDDILGIVIDWKK